MRLLLVVQVLFIILYLGTSQVVPSHHTDGVTAFHVSFLCLYCSQNDSCLTVFLTEGKRVFHVSILSLVHSGKGYASGSLSCGQASTYSPVIHTTLFFWCLCVCMYVRHQQHQPNIHILVNEASYISKQVLLKNKINYQLVTPHIHRCNASEHTIQTFKTHFITCLCAADPDYPAKKWDSFLTQATLTINHLLNCNFNPKLSAYADLHGIFYYTKNLLTLFKPESQYMKIPSIVALRHLMALADGILVRIQCTIDAWNAAYHQLIAHEFHTLSNFFWQLSLFLRQVQRIVFGNRLEKLLLSQHTSNLLFPQFHLGVIHKIQ